MKGLEKRLEFFMSSGAGTLFLNTTVKNYSNIFAYNCLHYLLPSPTYVYNLNFFCMQSVNTNFQLFMVIHFISARWQLYLQNKKMKRFQYTSQPP